MYIVYTMSEFKEHIKTWVSIDNELKKINERARELRAQRSNIGSNIIHYVEEQQLDQATVQISDGELRFAQSKYTAPLTFKHVEACLEQCLRDPDHVRAIIKYIKETRDTTQTLDIKRSYNDSLNHDKHM